MKNAAKILFIAEKSPWCYKAFDFLKEYFPDSQSIFWNHGDPKLPPIDWSGEWIISFKSDLILSKKLINSATKGALNFHPAPPLYRGIGGYVHSIYNGDDSYGVTCHHISVDIDNGQIIKARHFPLNKTETASSLREKAAEHCFILFDEIMQKIIAAKSLPLSDEA